MWNFEYIIPSFLVLAVIVLYYLSLPRLPITKNLVFIYLISLECLVILADILSSMADMNYMLFAPWQLYLLNSGYFIIFFIRAYIFFIFTCKVLQIDLQANTLRLFASLAPVIIGIFLILLTPFTKWFYYIDETGYHSSYLYNSLYVIFGLYLLQSFYYIFKKRTQFLVKRQLEITFWYNVTITIGLLARFLLPRFLLLDTFCLIAIILIFFTFENPHSYLAQDTFIFNDNALLEYLRETNRTKPINAFVFCIRNYVDILELYGLQQTNLGIYLIETYLYKAFPDYYIFYYRNARFVMIAKSKPNWIGVYAKLHKRFLKPWTSNDTEIFLDLGANIIEVPDINLPSEIILRLLADSFTQADKRIGNNLSIFDKTAVEKIKIENNIKRALDQAIQNDSIEVFLQPIFSSRTFEIVGAEALARIRDEDGTLISPSLFIPIAEKNGKIHQLGSQVFRKCCQFIKENDLRKLNLSFININLSPIQFMRVNLDEILADYVNESGANIDFIHLEITEESFVDELLMEQQISKLTKKGFKFVLDDYGRGYSNMARLRKSPFINIKLDMSIVKDYCSNHNPILPNEIKGFHQVGFEITAEGIENETMAKEMAEIGCTYLQGFYFSTPLPIDQFLKQYSNASSRD